MSDTTSLILHGHFYQPPRENPWLDIIERQRYAAPHHDYNHKIADECYTANAFSRFLDGRGRVLDIVNNYEFLSFNFGPTLLSWMQDQIPDTLERIIEGDKLSIKNTGYGSAMAQAYNHMIMPLADPKDRLTQILWGMEDFRYRFGRKAEGMWMPETAINQDTIDDLVACGIKFTILSPTQAERVRWLDEEEWIDVSDNDIDSSRTYRCYNSDRTDWLNIIFFDKPISVSVSFEHLLRDAEGFIQRLKESAHGRKMICIATDGEIYGHHEPFSNMCITAMALKLNQEKYGLKMTSAAAHLAENSPQLEVVLKGGEKGEGTAWSCSHSLGRWKRDCGCTTDSPQGWSQAWRAPLREGLDKLNQSLKELYQNEAVSFFTDPWKARDDYAEYLLNPGEDSFNDFLNKHGKRELDNKEKARALMLLEMQKYSMYMFTSCGWFFGEISRLEPEQNLKYACRAIQLAGLFKHGVTTVGVKNSTHNSDENKIPLDKQLEKELLSYLRKAKSNIPEIEDGGGVWEKHVLTAMAAPERFANYFAAATLLTGVKPTSLYGYTFKSLKTESAEGALCAYLEIKHGLSLYTEKFLVVTRQSEGEKLNSHIFTAPSDEMVKNTFHTFITNVANGSDFTLDMSEGNCVELGLSDLFWDERQSLMKRLMSHRLEGVRKAYREVYESNLSLIDLIAELGVKLPQELAVPAAQTISLDLRDKVDDFLDQVMNGVEKANWDEIDVLLSRAEALSLDMKTEELKKRVTSTLSAAIDSMMHKMTNEMYLRVNLLSELVEKLDLNIPDGELQFLVYAAIIKLVHKKKELSSSGRLKDMDFGFAVRLISLAKRMNFNTIWMKKELSPFEDEDE